MRRDAMRPLLFDPSVELPMGRDPCEGCAEMGVGTPCETSLWGRRWRSFWATIHIRGVSIWVELMRTLSLGLPAELPVGHGPFEGSVEICGGALCESSQWRCTWNSQWGTFRVKGVANWAEGRHANLILAP